MHTQLWPHGQESLFQYSWVSIPPINTHTPCSYTSIEI